MIRFLYLFIFINQIANAKEFRSVKRDFNKDGKVDQIDYYDKNKTLVKKEIDLNNDKLFDKVVLYSKEKIFETHFYNQKKSKNFHKKITLQIDPKDSSKILRTIFIDKNDDGKFEINYTDRVDRHQNQDLTNCKHASVLPDTPQTDDQLKLLADANGGFIPTSFGYEIDKVCIDKWGQDILNNLKDSNETGEKCLQDIHNASGMTQSSMALVNLDSLKELQRNSPIKLVCSENSDYDWNGVVAKASTGEYTVSISDPEANHPYISINPGHPEEKPISDSTLLDFKRTIFHESFHNIGHRHGHDQEFSYTCETCCFPEDNYSNEQKELSCKLCLGNYESETDINYVNDMIQWSKDNYRDFLGRKVVTNYAKENPSDEKTLVLLSKMNSSTFNNIGPELLRFAQNQDALKDQENINRVESIGELTYADNNEAQSTIAVAQAIFYTYHEQSSQKTLSVLLENEAKIKESIDKLKGSDLSNSDSEYWRLTFMKRLLEEVISETLVNKYPDTNEIDLDKLKHLKNRLFP